MLIDNNWLLIVVHVNCCDGVRACSVTATAHCHSTCGQIAPSTVNDEKQNGLFHIAIECMLHIIFCKKTISKMRNTKRKSACKFLYSYIVCTRRPLLAAAAVVTRSSNKICIWICCFFVRRFLPLAFWTANVANEIMHNLAFNRRAKIAITIRCT